VSDGIGARVLRKEDGRHLNGRALFVGDIWLPNLWEAAYVRSPIAHGRILSIAKPAGFPGRVFTAQDMTDVLPIRADSSLPTYKASNCPVLAADKVRFVGECMAICVAPTRDEAEDIAEAVVLDLEELTPVMDVEAARRADAPLVHDEWSDNLFLTTHVQGDLASIARTAPIVIEREYKLARQCMSPLEGKGVLAHWDGRADQLVVYSSTQTPHLIRTGLSEVLKMDQAQVRVIAPDVGGGFGYKCVLHPEEVSIAWVARHLGRPVRWIEDRREHLVAGANTRQHQYKIKAYADKSGRLLGLDAEIAVDIGAYSVWPFTACLEAAQAGGNLPGPYVLPAYCCTTYSVATNKPSFTPYRGVARPGVCFAMELTIDAIAHAAGREPADVRRENLVPPEAMPYTNITRKFYDSGNYAESVTRAAELICLEAVRARQARGEPDGRLVGVGFSTFTEQTAHGTAVFAAWGLPLVPGYEQATAKITPSGSVEIRSGNQSVGQGLETTIAQVACEWLKTRIDQVQVFMGDTGTTPYSTGAYASRSMVMAGGAVSKACETLAARLKIHAAHLLQRSPEEIELREGAAFAGQASATYKDIARAWYLRPDQLAGDVDTLGLEVTEGYKPDIDTGVFTYATHAAAVAVDPQTGAVEILDYAIFEDCGRRVNPMILEGQAYGGMAQGIGTALFEEVLYDDSGQPLTTTLSDYILPGPAELPSVKLGHAETLSPYTRHGIKGVGEGAAIAPAGAIVNAINDALRPLGVEINEAPATPRRILAAILARTRAGQAAP
jgi:aerobic carbon-monoxide dehydrogenase large subunit